MSEEIKYIVAPVNLTIELYDGEKKLTTTSMEIYSNMATAQLDIHDILEELKK